jgi:hypothetical protein
MLGAAPKSPQNDSGGAIVIANLILQDRLLCQRGTSSVNSVAIEKPHIVHALACGEPIFRFNLQHPDCEKVNQAI